MSTAELTFSIQDTAICPYCHLHQYSIAAGEHMASTKCRRCGQPLGIAYYKFQASETPCESMFPDRTPIQRSIGAFIRRMRMARHISQEALARRMAMHRTVVTKAEGGNFRNLAILLKAAAALDLEIDQVIVRVRDRRLRRP